MNAFHFVIGHNRGTRLDARQIADYCERFHGAIFRYIAYRVRHQADAEDLAAEVFMRALECRTPIRTSLLGLLYRIAENLITDYYRREATRKRVFDNGAELEALAIADPRCKDPSGTIDLVRGLGKLTGEQYQVIVMRFLEGYPIQDVAEALGKSPGAIKALQFRALEKLREALKDEVHATI